MYWNLKITKNTQITFWSVCTCFICWPRFFQWECKCNMFVCVIGILGQNIGLRRHEVLSTMLCCHTHCFAFVFSLCDRLVGLVVKSSASRAGDLEFESRLRQDFSGSSHTSDLKIGIPVATLPGTWRYRVSIGTGWPSVSILWLGGMESLICNFYLSVAACTIVWANQSLRYTSMLLGR